jgi:hypothetical protein
MIFMILYLTSTWALKGASFLFLWHDIWIIIFHCLDETRSTTQNPNYWSIQKNSLWCSSDNALLLKMKTLEAAPPPKKKNYLLWKPQMLHALRGTQVIGPLDGTDAAPTKISGGWTWSIEGNYRGHSVGGDWLTQDQQVMIHLLNSMTKDVLTKVIRLKHVTNIWDVAEDLFSL